MTHSLDNNIIPFLAVIITYFGLLTYIGYYATKQTRTLREVVRQELCLVVLHIFQLNIV